MAVKALACELPAQQGVPLARWHCGDLARAAVDQQVEVALERLLEVASAVREHTSLSDSWSDEHGDSSVPQADSGAPHAIRREPSLNASNMGKYTIQRPRHIGEIQGVDEEARVLDLPAAAGAHEAPKVLLIGPSLLRRLLLEGAERSKLTMRIDDLFHGGGTEGADQLVLQVRDAHVETECLHVGAGEVGAEAGPLETALEGALLSGVAKARQSDVKPLRAEQIQEPSDGGRTPNRQDRDALSVKVSTTALSQRFERDLVAGPFDEHDRT